MTGLLSRLAARGAGRTVAGGPARLTPPTRPRFAMPEAGEGIEVDAVVEGAGGAPEPSIPQVATTTPASLTPDRAAPDHSPPEPQTAIPATQPPSATPAAPVDSPMTVHRGAAQPDPRKAPEPTAFPELAEPHQPAPPEGRAPLDRPERRAPPAPQQAAPDPADQIIPPPDLPALETVERLVETEITAAPPEGFARETFAPALSPSGTPNAFPDPILPEPPAPSLSIGRIDVIFEAPDPPPAPRQRNAPDRTRGFERYADIRLGRRR